LNIKLDLVGVADRNAPALIAGLAILHDERLVLLLCDHQTEAGDPLVPIKCPLSPGLNLGCLDEVGGQFPDRHSGTPGKRLPRGNVSVTGRIYTTGKHRRQWTSKTYCEDGTCGR